MTTSARRRGDINNAFLFSFSLSLLLAASISLGASLGVFLRHVERQQIDSESWRKTSVGKGGNMSAGGERGEKVVCWNIQSCLSRQVRASVCVCVCDIKP